jgi:hypothetical protein
MAHRGFGVSIGREGTCVSILGGAVTVGMREDERCGAST